MSDELQPARLVYLGSCDLQGGKTGEYWATEAAAAVATDTIELRRLATVFSKGKRASTVGAVYEGRALTDATGKLTTIGRDLTYRAMLDTNAIAAMALRERGVRAREAAKKAEAKARAAGPADDLLDQLARIVAASSLNEQEAVIAGFAAEVRKRAFAIWRKQR